LSPEVDELIDKASQWQQEYRLLRAIVLGCGLNEEFKWYQPCYTYHKSIILVISGFKNSCVISFFKGALLKDSAAIMEKPGENTRTARLVRFTNPDRIKQLKPVLKAYIREAMEIESCGLKHDLSQLDQPVPEEFKKQLDQSPDLKAAFEALTPGRRRAYLIYFAHAKQAKTREARIRKCLVQILAGKGLAD